MPLAPGCPGSRLRIAAAAVMALGLGLMVVGAAVPAVADAGSDGGVTLEAAAPEAAAPQGAMPEDAPAVVADPDTSGTPAPALSLRRYRDESSGGTIGQRLLSALGLFVMVALGWTLSRHRLRFPWRMAAWGIGLQLAFGFFVLKTDLGRDLFQALNDAVMVLLGFTSDGARFIFGAYLDMEFSFALNVLPTIVFFSSLMTVLYHLGVMQWVVKGFAWAMQRTMGTSGSETLSAAANVFVGQTEAPLVVKPYVSSMTESELMAVMTGGFATVAGGVLAAYVQMLSATFEDIAGHLIAASVMSAPAALVIAKVMIPETEQSKTSGQLEMTVEKTDANVIDAAARGAGEGLSLALNVGAMLLAFLALVAMINYLLAMPASLHNAAVWKDVVEALRVAGHAVPAGCEAPSGVEAISACREQAQALMGTAVDGSLWSPLTMERMLGWVFWPIAWVLGVPAADCTFVAQLLGEKLVLNEFVAYKHLADELAGGSQLSYRSVVIVTYALCGFANFGSIAIQIGGIGGIAPNRRHDLARLGLRAMIGGTLAAMMTAAVAGMLI